jgi:hypothetical protein
MTVYLLLLGTLVVVIGAIVVVASAARGFASLLATLALMCYKMRKQEQRFLVCSEDPIESVENYE